MADRSASLVGGDALPYGAIVNEHIHAGMAFRAAPKTVLSLNDDTVAASMIPTITATIAKCKVWSFPLRFTTTNNIPFHQHD